jgi:hypothetical protein
MVESNFLRMEYILSQNGRAFLAVDSSCEYVTGAHANEPKAKYKLPRYDTVFNIFALVTALQLRVSPLSRCFHD